MDRLCDLEKRKDWPVIVTAVKCPECKAEVLSPCVYRGKDMPRPDFHAERKYLAVESWKEIERGSEPSTKRIEDHGTSIDGLAANPGSANPGEVTTGSIHDQLPPSK